MINPYATTFMVASRLDHSLFRPYQPQKNGPVTKLRQKRRFWGLGGPIHKKLATRPEIE